MADQGYATDMGRSRVGTFLALAFGISWGAYCLRRSASWSPVLDESLRLIVKFGPSLAGIGVATLYDGGRGLRNLLARLKIPFRQPALVALSLALPFAILLGALALRAGVGSSILPLEPMSVGAGLSLFGSLLATRFFLGGGLGEELGWRGVMLPALQPRVGALNASLLIGLAHGLWHLPAYGPGVILMLFFTVSGSIIFTWMANRTHGNLFLPALMHACANASLPFMEHIVPAIDGEVLYPVLVFLLWCLVAVPLVSRLDGHSPQST